MNEYSFIIQGLYIPVKSKIKNNAISIIFFYIIILDSYADLGAISAKEIFKFISFIHTEFIFIYNLCLSEDCKI